MATKPTRLRAVTSDDQPQPRKVHARITEALDGSSRDVLASMRHALAKKLDDGEVASNSIASAYKELRELDRLIRVMDATEEEQTHDESASEGRRSFNAAAI